MAQEEKAKAYDEAIKRAREWYNNPNSSSIGKSYLYAVFPELAESEDEKIRKEMISFFNGFYDNVNVKSVDVEPWIAYLEKQGEQKPVDVRTTGYWHVEDTDQKPAEWNKNDEVLLDETLHFIREFQQSDRCIDEGDMQNSVTCENWLKSLKDRVQPQKTWKPSEEQMEVLLSEVKGWTRGCPKQIVLESLYQDLKKL